MKNRQKDCYFEHDGKTIWVCVKPDNKPVRSVLGVEKMSGFFEFFDGDDNALGTIAFYENYEDMTPVRTSIAEAHYIKMQKIK